MFAEEIAARVRQLPDPTTEPVRKVRREFSARLRDEPADTVLAVADLLVDHHPWVGYELIYHHPTALSRLTIEAVERLGRRLDGWAVVDAFACCVTGPAWRQHVLTDAMVHGWARSPDRWWRRTALVSTVPLNLRARGGTGDTGRTLPVCRLLIEDRDDMVVKAMSWALRQLTVWDPSAVEDFLSRYRELLAPRVIREVRHKLTTGRKHPPRAHRRSSAVPGPV